MSDRLFYGIFTVTLLLTLGVALREPELTWFNIHQARDVARAFDWIDGTADSVLGPEINHGHRLPGPSFYLVLAAAWQLTGSLAGVVTLLHFLAIALTALFTLKVVKPRLGAIPTLIFWLTFALMPTHVLVSRSLWNPSLVLPVSMGYLLALGWYERRRDWRALALFYALGAVGIQFHLSMTLGLAVGTAWIWTLERRWPRAALLGVAGVAFYWLAIWGATDGYAEYIKSVRIDYAVPGGIDTPVKGFSQGRFLTSIRYHLFFYQGLLSDDELFAAIHFYLGSYDPAAHALLTNFSKLGDAFSVMIVVAYLHLAVLTVRGRSEPWERLVVLWILLGLSVLAFYRVKGGTFPYRYGMMFYPMQYLALALSFRRWLEGSQAKARVALTYGGLVLATVIFVGNACVLEQIYRIARVSGRISYSGTPDQEVVLREKIEVLKRVDVSAPPESFMRTMHGGIANRIRNFEFEDYNMFTWRGGLSQALLRSGTPRRPEESHYALSIRPVEQWLSPADSQAASALQARQLDSSDLPRDIEIAYYDPWGDNLGRQRFSRGDVILPVLRAPETCTELSVTFQLDPGRGSGLQVWYDRAPPTPALVLQSARANGRDLPVVHLSEGRWLEQSLARVEVGKGAVRCELSFRVIMTGNYSRLDIFRE